MNYKIEKILEEYVCKDVSGLIMDFALPKCKICKEHEYEDFCLETYDSKYICGLCYIKEDYYTCYKCYGVYRKNTFNFCLRCIDNCRMFCPRHLKNRYKVEYHDIDIMMDIVDNIFEILETDTTFNNRYY